MKRKCKVRLGEMGTQFSGVKNLQEKIFSLSRVRHFSPAVFCLSSFHQFLSKIEPQGEMFTDSSWKIETKGNEYDFFKRYKSQITVKKLHTIIATLLL